MNRRLFATGAAALISAAALAMLLCAMSGAQISNFGTVWLKPDEYAKPQISSARAAPQDAPTVMAVDPTSAPNDLDTPIVITGTGFTAGLTVTLGNTQLPDAGWVSSTMLTATVPWGMNPGVYTLTIVNPDGQSGSLPNAFTVTQGIGVWTTGGPYGGQVKEIVINPITPTTLYANVSPYAVFRSRDGGTTWKPIRIDIGYGPLVIDPLAPDTLYVKGSVCWPLYRTDDGGDSWVALPNIVPGCQAPLIFAHPLISGTIYGITGAGLWKSEDRGQTWITWTHNLTDSRITGMAFDPTDPLKLYVGTYHGNTFHSVDGGESWQFIGQASHQVSNLTINPFIPDELWALRPYGGGGYGLGLSKYESGSWTLVFTTPVHSFVASRSISGTMWIGTMNGSLKSTDGGHTWLPFGNLPPGRVIGLDVDPTDSNVVYLNAGGRGVYKTTDDGVTSYPINNGLAGIVPMAMAVMPGNPSTVYAMEGGVGTFKTNNGGGSWLQLPNENTFLATVGVDPITPTRVYLATGGEYVDISEDGGYNWHRAVLSAPVQYQDCAVENQAMIVNAGLAGHLVMGVGFVSGGEGDYIAGGIYTSTDYGESWTYVDLDVGHAISHVVSLAYDPLNPTVIYAGTRGASVNSPTGYGELLKSSDGGDTWQSVQAGRSTYFFESMAVEPGPLHRVLACCGDAGIYVSTDGGMSWTPAISSSSHYLNQPHFTPGDPLVFAPGDPPMLYGGTDSGLYRSIDGAQSWQPAAGTLGSVNVYALAVGEAQDRVILYAATAGGIVSGGATQAQSLASGETLVSAGVYRYTNRPFVAAQSVDISGPTQGNIQIGYTFTTTVNPVSTTVPLYYAWQATGQAPVTHTSGLSDTATFAWDTPGTPVITVTASNGATVTDTRVVVINAPLTGVDLRGLAKGYVNATYAFTATASPIVATLPITYLWQATGLALVSHTGGLSDTVSFTWNITGGKVITVTASNGVGAQVADVHTITVEQYLLYLPLVLRIG